MDHHLVPRPAADVPRLMYSIPTAARQLSLSRSTVFDLLCRNELTSVKVGARRLVAHSDLEAFIERRRTNESATGPRLRAALMEGSISAPAATG
jgi:excisionase family DNA binding protein